VKVQINDKIKKATNTFVRVRLRESKAIISTFSSLSLSLSLYTKAGSVVIATSLVIILATLGQFNQHFYMHAAFTRGDPKSAKRQSSH